MASVLSLTLYWLALNICTWIIFFCKRGRIDLISNAPEVKNVHCFYTIFLYTKFFMLH